MNNERYSMAFTTGGLFHRDSVKLAVLYLELQVDPDYPVVFHQAIDIAAYAADCTGGFD